MTYDEERPAGFQDADIEQAEMEALANHETAIKGRGICTHGRWVGVSDSGEVIYPEQEGLTGSQVRCTDGCGQVFVDQEDLYAARDEVLS